LGIFEEVLGCKEFVEVFVGFYFGVGKSWGVLEGALWKG
jgi:hypothetical protein